MDQVVRFMFSENQESTTIPFRLMLVEAIKFQLNLMSHGISIPTVPVLLDQRPSKMKKLHLLLIMEVITPTTIRQFY